MDWFILKHIFSTIFTFITIGRLSLSWLLNTSTSYVGILEAVFRQTLSPFFHKGVSKKTVFSNMSR